MSLVSTLLCLHFSFYFPLVFFVLPSLPFVSFRSCPLCLSFGHHLWAVFYFTALFAASFIFPLTCVGQVTLCPSFGTFATDIGPSFWLWASFTSQTGLCGSRYLLALSCDELIRTVMKKNPAQIWFWGGVKAVCGSAAAGILTEVDLFTRADAPSSASTPRLMCSHCLFKG